MSNGKAGDGEGYARAVRSLITDRAEISATDVPLRKPAGCSPLGLPGMGAEPGTDAGRHQQATGQGNPDPQDRTDDCAEKEELNEGNVHDGGG